MISVLGGINIGDTIKFDVIAPNIIGTSFTGGCKLIGLLDQDSANSMFDTVARHHAILPEMEDPVELGYMYLKVRLPNGKFDAVGIPWIKEGTLELAGGRTLRLEWPNLTSVEIAGIKGCVSDLGFPAIEIP